MELLSGYASSSSTSSCDSLIVNDQRQKILSCTRVDKGANERQELMNNGVGESPSTAPEVNNPQQPLEKRKRHDSNECDQYHYSSKRNNNNGGFCIVPKFERNHPHWEGRWTGHLRLPFPPLEHYYLDVSSDLVERRSESDEEDARDVNDKVLRKSRDACWNDDDSSRSTSCSGEEIDDIILQSRIFLLTARKLIRHWEMLLQQIGSGGSDERNNSAVVPHIPMQPLGSTLIPTSHAAAGEAMITTNLHISLARPIYLPSASVDSFMTCIEKNILASTRGGATKQHAVRRQPGRILHLQPRNTTIFTNDQQNRSFLSIPVSKESSRWVKQSLLPPIDAAMVRFGLETYYNNLEGGEGCILHVSVASVKGNVIPQLLHMHGSKEKKNNATMRGTHSGDERSVRSLPLFVPEEGKHELPAGYLESIPSSIPIRFDRIQCSFGTVKQLTIPI